MATSSFTKTFVFDAKAVETMKVQPGVKVPASANNRVKEGKAALTRFSPRSKK